MGLGIRVMDPAEVEGIPQASVGLPCRSWAGQGPRETAGRKTGEEKVLNSELGTEMGGQEEDTVDSQVPRTHFLAQKNAKSMAQNL